MDPETICKSTQDVVQFIESTLRKAQETFQENPERWIESEISKHLGPNIGNYARFYSTLGLNGQEELQQLFKDNFKNKAVQEVYEELLEAEDEWNKFLASADQTLITGQQSSPISEGGFLSQEIQLLTHREEKLSLCELFTNPGDQYVHLILLRHFAWLPWRDHVAKVEEELHMFASAGCKVVVVSFGTSQGAQNWLEQTKTGLNLYLDPTRALYSKFGLARSVMKVWNMKTIHYYASQKAQGRQLPTALAGVEDDPLQMGGDFTINRNLELVMSYACKTPSDRPSVQHILSKL